MAFKFNRTVLGFVVWVSLNMSILWGASTLRTVVVDSWKKGPLIDPSAPYAPENAQWYVTWIVLWLVNSYLIGLFVLFRRSAENSVVRKWGPLVLLLCSTILAETGMQVYLQYNQTTHFRPHPTLHWMCRPNLQSFVSSSDGIVLNTNRHGMREGPNLYIKEANEYRIIVLGDSSNFGQGVSGEEMWSSQLQTILSAAGIEKVSVLNAACPGWTTHQGVEVMDAYGWKYQPDLVIAGFNNDAGPDFMTDRERVSKRMWVRQLQSILYQSEVFVISREAILAWIRRLSPTAQQAYRTRLAGEKAKYGTLNTSESLPLVSRVPLQEMEENLLHLQQQSKENDARLMWVNMPINRKEFGLVDRYVDWTYRDRIRIFTEENRIPYVGVDEYWLRSRESDLHILGHVFHPNKEGHRRMAEQIAKSISEQNWMQNIDVESINIEGPPPANTIEVLRLGWSSKTPIHAHLGVALQLHPELIEQFGLEIEWVSYDSGKVQGKDLASGKLDAWFSCAVPAIHMLDTRPDAKVVATFGPLGDIALLKREKDSHQEVDGETGDQLQQVGLVKGSTPHQVWMSKNRNPSVGVEYVERTDLKGSLQQQTLDGIVTWDPWVREWSSQENWSVAWQQPFSSVLIVGEMWALGNLKDPRVPRLVSLFKALIVEIEKNPESIDRAVAELGGWSLDTVRSIREENPIFSQKQDIRISSSVIQELRDAHRFVHPKAGGFYAMAPEWIDGLPRRP